jgi:DNA-binding transcriptional regulator YdaS (Cro superfamily)
VLFLEYTRKPENPTHPALGAVDGHLEVCRVGMSRDTPHLGEILMSQTQTQTKTMTEQELLEAVAQLAPEAISSIEATLQGRETPNKARMDTAWRVLEWSKAAAQQRAEATADTPEVEELRNVLSLVGEW